MASVFSFSVTKPKVGIAVCQLQAPLTFLALANSGLWVSSFIISYLQAHVKAIITYALPAAHMVFVPIMWTPRFPFHFCSNWEKPKSPSPYLLPRRKRTGRHSSVSSTVCNSSFEKSYENLPGKESLLERLCMPLSSTPTLVPFALLWTLKAGFNSVQVVPEGLFWLLCFPTYFYVLIKQVLNVQAAESKQKILNWILCPVFNRNRK